MSLSKKVLITGIDGFTGFHLEKFLQSHGLKVYGTTFEKMDAENYFHCDIRSYEDIKSVIIQVNPDYIIHLAAISFTGENDSSLIYATNVTATENILLALVNNNLSPDKIIIASSASVYGNQNVSELHEKLCPAPVNHYGISKLAMEHMGRTYFDKLNILIVRPFNYTGPKQEEHFLIPKIISHYKEKKSFIELGNINVAREFNDIRFVVAAYYKLLLFSPVSEVVNLCTGNAWELAEIIALLDEMMGYKINIVINPEFCRDNEIAVLKGSTEKLYSVINDVQSYTIKETLFYLLSSK